jgi:hypothetical protein
MKIVADQFVAMKPSLPLSYTAILMGRFSRTVVKRSPRSMETPPSPARQITCRPGWHFCSPSADGMPSAIVLWSRLPKVRRLPPVSIWRSIQTNGVPSSAAKSALRERWAFGDIWSRRRG